MSTSRPILKLQRTKTDWIIDSVGVIGLVAMWIYAMTYVPMLPDSIPVHYGATGQPDRWSSRGTILTLPTVATVMFVLLLIVGRFPHRFNYLVEVTEENAARLYRLSRLMLACIRAEMVWLLAIIVWLGIEVGTGRAESLDVRLVFGALGVIMVTVLGFIIAMSIQKNASETAS